MSSGRTPKEIAKFISELPDSEKLKLAEFLRKQIPANKMYRILHVLPVDDRLSFLKSDRIDFNNRKGFLKALAELSSGVDVDFLFMYMSDIVKFDQSNDLFNPISAMLSENSKKEFKEKFEETKAKSEKTADGIYVAPGASVTIFGRNASARGATVGKGAKLLVISGPFSESFKF